MSEHDMKAWMLAVAGLFFVGCVASDSEATGDGEFDMFTVDGKADGFTVSMWDIEAVLGVINSATLEDLDIEIGLDIRAAQGIIKFRAGADGRLSTADDVRFVSLKQLDDVPYVGAKAFASLVEYARISITPPACFVVSEYVEGAGTYTKGIELYNCGNARTGKDVGVCLVRNGDSSCSVTTMSDVDEVPAKGVVTLCRSLEGRTGDPVVEFKERCDVQIGTAASFNGDDRMIVFQDIDGDSKFGTSDVVLDVFGAVPTQPDGMPWSNVVLRRVKADANTNLGSTSFETLKWFSAHPSDDFSDFGVAPRFRFL
jgi:hypothetical protein